MDDQEIMMGAMLLLMTSTAIVFLNKRRNRRFKIRPMNRDKRINVYKNLLNYAETHDRDQFFKYTRMSPEMFDHLLDLVKPYIERDPTKLPIEPGQRLVFTLHYLSEGCSMQDIGKTTVHCIIEETCQVSWRVLAPFVLPQSRTEDLVNISEGFYRRWNIPNCIGVIDGKHINIQCPKKSGTVYVSYKKSFSIVLMASHACLL